MSLIANPVELLTAADHPSVRLLDSGHGLLRMIPATEAAQIIARGGYQAHGGKSRVKSIMPAPARMPEWQECYRTAGSPVLQPSVEWLNSRRSGA